MSQLRAVVTALVAAVSLTAVPLANGANGPVVLGGDNFPGNGQVDTITGALQDGWLAMQRSLEYVSPRVGRFNDNSVAVVGARASSSIAADAGAAIGLAAGKVGLPVTYLNGADSIGLFFEDLRTGRARPRIMWLAGTQGGNGLDSAELAILNANAETVAQFVAGGGGLIAHGDQATYAGWLSRVAPGLSTSNEPGSGLALTTFGAGVLPGVTNPNISLGTWSNSFSGPLGDLSVVADAVAAFEPDGVTPRKVVLAGGTAWSQLAPADLRVTTTAPVVVDRGDVVRYTVQVTNEGPNLVGDTVVTHTIPPGWAFGGAATGAGSCQPGPPITCTLRGVGVGKTVPIAMSVKALRAGTATALTEVVSPATDPNAFDNRDGTTTTARMARLRVRTLAPDVATDGQEITVRISVRNTGRRVAKKVILRSPTPPGFVLERRPAGGRIEGGGAIWELGSISPGRTRVVVFRLRVDTARTILRCLPGHARANNVNFTSASDCLLIRP